MPLNLTLGGGANPSGVQFSLNFPSADVGVESTVIGPAASSKSVTCNPVSAGKTNCLVVGINTDPISNGVIATVNFRISAGTASNSASVTLSGLSATSPAGTGVNITGSGGTITINQPTPVNHAPTANSASVSTNEDTAKSITLSGSDVDGDSLSFSILSQPSKGSLSGSGANRTYTPSANVNGSDSFTFRVSDGNGGTGDGTISITINAVNDAPTAQNQSVTTAQDTAKAITLGGSDIDSSSLTYSILSQPSHGSVSGGSGAGRTYTPASGYSGSDSFTFRVSDGSLNATGTVSITVTAAANNPPTATNGSTSTNEDTPKALTLVGGDPDGDPITYSIISGPSHGSVSSGTGAGRIYTPSSNYFGSDSFTFRVTDSHNATATATFSITVNSVNDAPTAQNLSISTAQNTAKALTLLGSDIDSNNLTYSILSQPSHGSVSGGTGSGRTYTPANGYSGSDSFTYQVSDGSLNASATVSITVTAAANNPPTATNGSSTTNEDTPKLITLSGSDPDGDTITFSIISGPSHGSVSAGTGAGHIYTPNENYFGSDSFSFRVTDSNNATATATFNITVSAVNDAPTAQNLSISTAQNTAKAVTLAGSDIDSNNLSYSIVSQPSHGTVSGGSSASRTYTPANNYSGADSFTYQVSDGSLSATAVVSITVAAGSSNTPPSAVSSNVSTNEDTPKQITLSATDSDGDSLTFDLVNLPSKGALAGSGAVRTYTPNPDVNGSDSFVFRVSDGKGGSDTATVNITIVPVNDAPTAQNQSVATQKNKSLPITLSGSDVDGDALTYLMLGSPSHGSVSGSAPNVTYTPTNGYSGADSFRFRVRDPQGASADGTISIAVGGGGSQNSPPGPHNQHVTTSKNKATALTLTASDADGDSLTYSVASSPAHGSLSGAPPNLTYSPANGFVGEDSFTFKVDDGTASANGTVTITVADTTDPDGNKPPTASSESVSTNQGEPQQITLKGSDPDGDPLTFTVTGNPSHGSLSGAPPNLTYLSNGSFTGSDAIVFQVSDGKGGQATGTITINVLGAASVGLSSVTCSGGALTGGGFRTCQVALTDRAPGGGVTVNLSCQSKQLVVPSSVRVSPRASTAQFRIYSSLIEKQESVQLAASLSNGASLAPTAVALGDTVTTELDLVPLQPSDLSCAPVQVKAGSSFTCRATLNVGSPGTELEFAL